MICQKREQNLGDIFCESRLGFYPDDSEMFRQWQNDPVSKMSIECDQRSLLLYSSFQNQRVVSTCLANLGRANDIMSGIT